MRDEFQVKPVNVTITAGSSAVIAFRVTNTVNETLQAVEAKLVASDPLSSDNDEAFVSRLEPAESTTLKFGVSVADGVIPKTYPVLMDFIYENERGDTVRSDPSRMPIEVAERERSGLPFLLDVSPVGFVAAGIVAVALGVIWWKRDVIARQF